MRRRKIHGPTIISRIEKARCHHFDQIGADLKGSIGWDYLLDNGSFGRLYRNLEKKESTPIYWILTGKLPAPRHLNAKTFLIPPLTLDLRMCDIQPKAHNPQYLLKRSMQSPKPLYKKLIAKFSTKPPPPHIPHPVSHQKPVP